MSKSYAQRSSLPDKEVVVEITTAGGAIDSERPVGRVESEPFARFRRRLERFRGVAEEEEFTGSLDDEDDLRLQVMLLREENAWLKAARHKPADAGSMIDRMRLLAQPDERAQLLDESWSVLGDCLALREGLDQACVEIQAAIKSVRERLSTLTMRIETIGETIGPDETTAADDNDSAGHEDRTSLSA